MARIAAVILVVGLLGICQRGEKSEEHTTRPEKVLPQMTRERLLACGFKESATARAWFVATNVQLSEIARVLGFSENDLQPSLGQRPGTDSCYLNFTTGYLLARSGFPDGDGSAVPPRRPGAKPLYTVYVSLIPRPQYAVPDDKAHVRVLSVSVPPGAPRTLEVTFEMWCDGKTPVWFARSDFAVNLKEVGASPEDFSWTCDVTLQKAPEIISLSPRKPVRLSVSVSGEFTKVSGWSNMRRTLAAFPAGGYRLVMGAGSDQRLSRRFDFESKEGALSAEYHFELK